MAPVTAPALCCPGCSWTSHRRHPNPRLLLPHLPHRHPRHRRRHRNVGPPCIRRAWWHALASQPAPAPRQHPLALLRERPAEPGTLFTVGGAGGMFYISNNRLFSYHNGIPVGPVELESLYSIEAASRRRLAQASTSGRELQAAPAGFTIDSLATDGGMLWAVLGSG